MIYIVCLHSFPSLIIITTEITPAGHCWSNESLLPALRPYSPSPRLHPSSHPKCTHAYILSCRGARRLHALLTYAPFAYSRAIDQAYMHLIESGLVRAYSVVPSVVVQWNRGGKGKGEEGGGVLLEVNCP